jgi:protein phosphatase 1 regulatory subunit 7
LEPSRCVAWLFYCAARFQTLDLTNLRATKLPDLSSLHQLQKLTFRQNWLTNFSCLPPAEGGGGCPHLTELDLYENKLASLADCRFPPDLVTLDLSFNELKHIDAHLASLKHLRELYLVSNRLKKMEGFSTLTRLRLLELGSNNLRAIDGAELAAVAGTLEELWLGRNKITTIEGLEQLTKLKKLSIQSNRITTIGEGLAKCTNLRELYLSHNGLTGAPGGLETLVQLGTLDLAGNKLSSLVGVGLERLTKLEELWLNDNELADWALVEPVLRALAPSLKTVYLEHNPLQKLQSPAEYVARVRACVPNLQQLDATLF